MSNNNESARWVKNGNVHTNDDFKFKVFRRKNVTNSLMKNDFKNTIYWSSECPMNETIKSEDVAQEKWQHITNRNSLGLNFAELYSNPFKNNHPSQPMTNSTEVVVDRFNLNHSIVTDLDNSNNNRPNVKNDLPISESWKEEHDVDKMKDAWLSYVNSPSCIALPFINLQTIANPYVQIPIEICRMVSNMNPKMGEVLCRKRNETAMILWIANKLKH